MDWMMTFCPSAFFLPECRRKPDRKDGDGDGGFEHLPDLQPGICCGGGKQNGHHEPQPTE